MDFKSDKVSDKLIIRFKNKGYYPSIVIIFFSFFPSWTFIKFRWLCHLKGVVTREEEDKSNRT